ncbi:trypsin-like serine protease [Xenorhabdus sp. Flor]|nr:trypsin-like serine protease [Xenorhabdus sp. Flor]
MIIIRLMFILIFLFHCSNSFSDGALKSLPLKAIAGGEESCKDIESNKCKPWVVSIYYVDKNNQKIMYCSGSLIAPDYVLTAAHCEVKNIGDIKKYIIENYKKEEISTALPEGFKSNYLGADFALIKLEKKVNLDNYGRIRRFFNYDEAYEKLNKDYYQSSIYGYGLLGFNKETGEKIENDGTQRRADVKIFTLAIDSKDNQGLMVEASKNKELSSGVIQMGDSGGPIIWNDTIIGVSSWGDGVLKIKDKNNYPYFFVSDVTGKHADTGLSKQRDNSSWFSGTMKQIWISNPDWNANLSKRGKYVVIKGKGRVNSKIEVVYSIENGKENVYKCGEVDYKSNWQCSIPHKKFFVEGIDEEKEYKVTITAREANISNNSWRKDTVQAKIPHISEEFGIVYPADKSTILTKNFMIRGYADPGSEVELILQSTDGKKIYTQDNLCKGLEKNKSIRTEEYGLWSCAVKGDVIDKIENDGMQYKITANQKTGNINLYDQVNVFLKPQEYTELKLERDKKNKSNIYRKKVEYDVGYAKGAKAVCIFNSYSYDCMNNSNDKNKLYLINTSGRYKTREVYIGAIQKIEDADPFDKKLWYGPQLVAGGDYFNPNFIGSNSYDIKKPYEISSEKLKGGKLSFSGSGGDDKSYTEINGDIILPSEYSICMKKEDNSPLLSESSRCHREEDKDIYLKIPLEDGRDFSEIPIKYGTHLEKNNFPIWDISLPSKLKDGFYYIEVSDKYHPFGLRNIKKDWMGLSPDRSYFRITTPEVKITTPSAGETSTVGIRSFLSGSANVPGDEVDVKRRRIDPSSPKLEAGNQGLVKGTSICTGAVVSDNGNWQCDTPIIFSEGTYELTAELIKEGKVVATDVTRLTIKKKNDDDDDDDNPENKRFEIDNPKDNSPVDPDNPIRLSGTYSGSGFGGFLSSLTGAIFGGVESLVGSALSSGLGFFWEFSIMPEAILGGDTYTLGLQETKNGVHVGNPVTLHFTIPMRITSPAKGAQYRLHDGITIEGQGSPGQLVLVAGVKEFLPSEKMTLPMSNEGILCSATVDSTGKWACPYQPVLTANNEGVFSLYADQYRKTSSTEFGGTYERTSQVTRRYEVTKTKIQITHPSHGAKITTLPFTIAGTGEKGAKVYIKGFGGTKDCNTAVDASGKWSCGSYQPEEGKYSVSADQFVDNTLNSSSSVSFEVQTKTIKPVVITQPHNGGVYQHLENILPKGTGEPGTVVCLDKKELSQICQNGVTVDDKGHWEWIDGLDTSVKGEQKLVATAFLDKVRQSTAKVTFDIVPAPGETTLAVKSPKEDEIIKKPSYTFSGTMPGNAKTVTVKAFGGHDDCSAKLNRKDYTWTCGPYSSVPGDYDATIVDDAGSQINRSFKVRYGDNLQMRVLNPAEGEQIATPTYTIAGKGQAGALIIVSISGKLICKTYVDGNQNWVCPDPIESVTGVYKLLAQQWVDNEPSGKSVTRNFEVIYMSDIIINPTAKPICAASSESKIAKLSVKYIPVMKSNETISIPITGTATKGAYISLKATSANGDSRNCGPVQVSKTNGQWSCSLHNVQPGTYQIEATQYITVNGQFHKKMKEGNVDASVLSISIPPEGTVRVSYHPPINVKVAGNARPKMNVSYKVQNDEDTFCHRTLLTKEPLPPGDIKKGSIVADDQGYWHFDAKLSQFGKKNITVSAQFCGQLIYSESNFCYRPYMR